MSAQGIFLLLDQLIEQTKLGNAKWQPTGAPYEYIFRGSSASVVLSTVDDDGLYPISIIIRNADDVPLNTWNVSRVTEQENERAFDDRVRELWDLVSGKLDSIASLIRDLENMPPF